MNDRTVVRGPLLRPGNALEAVPGPLPPTAPTVEYRGVAVSSRVHLEAVPPVLLGVLGPTWFEVGTLSLWFVSPSVDGEAAQVVAERSESGRAQTALRIERPGGDPVAVGTASLGDTGEPTEVERRFLVETPAVRPVEILRDVEPGERFGPVVARIDGEHQRRRLERGQILAPLDWYGSESPWGGPIATLHTAVSHLGHLPVTELRHRVPPATVVYRAVELRFVHGPLFLDRDYEFGAQVIDVGASEHAEALWYRAWVDDDLGRRVADLTLLARLVPEGTDPHLLSR